MIARVKAPLRSALFALSATACLTVPAIAADRALLVGVGDYANLPAELFLPGPKNDVEAVKGLLTGSLGYAPEAVKILRGPDATKAGITAEFKNWLVAGTEPGDRVFFYFSGHGLQLPDDNGDENDNRDEAIAPYDIRPTDTSWEDALRDDDLDALIKDLPGRVVTFLVDACHSGTVTRSLGGGNAAPAGARFLTHPSVAGKPAAASRGIRIEMNVVDKPETLVSWSAAAPYQLAWDDHREPEDQRHGVFTSAYVAGIGEGKADTNGNGTVSHAELLTYLRSESDTYCADNPECQSLTPQLEAPDDVIGYSVAPAVYDVEADTYVPPAPEEAYVPADPAPEKYEDPAVYEQDPGYAIETYYEDNHYEPEEAHDAISEIIGKPSDGRVRMTMTPSTTLNSGDVFKIEIDSDVPGNLVLFDIAEDGTALQLFPNDVALKNTRLTPGSLFVFPDDDYGFDMEAEGPSKGSLLAIVVDEEFDYDKYAPASRGLAVVLEDAKHTAAEIVTELDDYVIEEPPAGYDELPVEDYVVREKRWSYALVPYVFY
ncbi:caspase family protein [Cucumibacter marinus]|uniref:caspase family protein n=1 Tax=Cucumibacter marinus TaxID=1121252 RepID=UPI000409009D|nr:caspase family protein [Cucumibacter marinus]